MGLWRKGRVEHWWRTDFRSGAACIGLRMDEFGNSVQLIGVQLVITYVAAWSIARGWQLALCSIWQRNTICGRR